MDNLPHELLNYICDQVYNNNIVYTSKQFYEILSSRFLKKSNDCIIIKNGKPNIDEKKVKYIVLTENGKLMSSKLLLKMKKIVINNANERTSNKLIKYTTHYVYEQCGIGVSWLPGCRYYSLDYNFERLVSLKLKTIRNSSTISLSSTIKHVIIEGISNVTLKFQKGTEVDTLLVSSFNLSIEGDVSPRHTVYRTEINCSNATILEFRDVIYYQHIPTIESLILSSFNFDLKKIFYYYPNVKTITVRNNDEILKKFKNLNFNYFKDLLEIVDNKPYKTQRLAFLGPWSSYYDLELYELINNATILSVCNEQMFVNYKKLINNDYIKKYFLIYQMKKDSDYIVSDIRKNLHYIYDIIENKEFVPIDDIICNINDILFRIIDYKNKIF